jgi:AcrR family transcriptional regulator
MPQQRKSPDAARRSQPTRQAILTAALELAGEVGYARLSIEGIAARAGAGKQTIYRWWPSKGAVLFDALLALSEGAGAAELPDTGDLATDLKAVLRATVDELNNPALAEPVRALTVEVLVDPVLAESWRTRLDGPIRAMKLRRLRAAQEAGDLDPDVDLEVAADLIWGPLQNRWLFGPDPLTHAYADAVVDTALAGIAQASRRRSDT